MRVVIDTGVFTSAAIKAQTVPGIAVYRAAQRGLLLKSRSTEAELVEVIDRPRLARLIAPAARARLVELMSLAELVTITERIAECSIPGWQISRTGGERQNRCDRVRRCRSAGAQSVSWRFGLQEGIF